MSTASIPVLTYHSIAPRENINPSLFESHLKALADSGLPSLLPDQLSKSDRGFLVSFDDGYADLWTYAFPLLKKYNIKAVVFIIPSKIGIGVERPIGKSTFDGSINQALRESACSEKAHPAFLRWSELQTMEASGLIIAQSHSYFHRMGWVSDKITGFYIPPFLPAHWSLGQATGGDIRPGIPLYQRGAALGHHLYFDDPGLRDYLAQWYERQVIETQKHSEKPSAIIRKIFELTSHYRLRYSSCGRWETDEEREKRSLEDIGLARNILEERLGGRRDELCLPWGHYDRTTIDLAAKAGISRIYTLDKGANPAQAIGFSVCRFEPRPKGKFWLCTRLWIYRSKLRADLYRRLSRA